ncbi:MAG: acyltransferase family protein [Alphaproteobacteria bacterium]|nr:acyltransferase family protein [Alphaproteobacteria bacterium]MBX9977748.1 acyltransferase family protein [Alphaproteobacteria bacterium]
MSDQGIKERYLYLDYARAFLLLILAFDHSTHAYASTWGRLHFLQDIDRSSFFDFVYMFSNSMVMPGLFFLMGLFTVSSLERNGIVRFFAKRWKSFGWIFVLGILLVGPLLVYPSNVLVEGKSISLLEYMTSYYFEHDLSVSGPFWVLYALFLYAGLGCLCYRFLPPFRWIIQKGGKAIVTHPHVAVLSVILASCLILGVSDFYWGAIYWVKLWWIFSIQGGRFIFLALYFLIGLMLGTNLTAFNENLVQKYARKWPIFGMITLALGGIYMGFSLSAIEEGAYGSEIRQFLREGGMLLEAFPLINEYGMPIIVRTSLHGTFCLFQIISLILVFSHFSRKKSAFWSNWSDYAYLVFIVHELPVLWLQYLLLGADLPVVIKVAINFFVGVLGTWFILRWAMPRRWIAR